MALIGKREDLIHVPWSSVEEWLQVYKQIYSGDLIEQTKAYETLLVWKARIPKLPVGAECTLGLIQVCLRDREWTPMINSGKMSLSYENDLRMMYSTVIMKFLNHISNIAHSKQTSLFVIAKQLNIPDWIVDLRHDTAHGYELPSIDVMRVVANILLTWLHKEYWAAEATSLEDSHEFQDSINLCNKDDEILIDLIELWTAAGLYIKTKHVVLSDLPDTNIKETLLKLFSDLKTRNPNGANAIEFTISDETELSSVLNFSLIEISKNLSKGNSALRKETTVIESILSNEAFLTNSEMLSIFIEEDSNTNNKNCLPASLIEFWKDFILVLQEKKMLLPLFFQLIELIKSECDRNKKLMAALWVKTLAQAFNKQKIARHIYQTLEQKFDCQNKKCSLKAFVKSVNSEVEKCYPDLKKVPNLNVNGDFPNCLLDISFVRRLVLNFNEFSEHFLPEILKISSFFDSDSIGKDKLLKLLKAHSIANKVDEMEVENDKEIDVVYTVQDLKEIENNKKCSEKKDEKNKELADCKIRNTNWTFPSEDCDWNSCPIGILPWQVNDFQPIEPLTVSPSDIHYAIVKNLELPKIVGSSKLKMQSNIQWENLLKKKKKTKKKTKMNDPMKRQNPIIG